MPSTKKKRFEIIDEMALRKGVELGQSLDPQLIYLSTW